jgi:uncharacterized phosphosugar-binding protein
MTREASINLDLFAQPSLIHLREVLEANRSTLERLGGEVVERVKRGERLLVAGSGHSSLFPLELYHRAGGVHFVLPIVADYLLPSAGPSVVRALERTPGALLPILDRFQPSQGEMIWIASQSGINPSGVELALEATRRGMRVVAFTSVIHSRGVPARHSSGKRLFEVAHEVIDLGGRIGDAIVPVHEGLSAGPVSTLTSVFLGHALLVAVGSLLERQGVRCVYTSVNTPDGESRNRNLESEAGSRDFLLR